MPEISQRYSGLISLLFPYGGNHSFNDGLPDLGLAEEFPEFATPGGQIVFDGRDVHVLPPDARIMKGRLEPP